ncbi:MAG: Histidine--tRNA ligase [Phycisphaerae bacterium]|nr:Histidine--tRNA ligase [Phycisphaerae bacterium]
MKFQNVKGTRDFYPEEMVRRNWLMGMWRKISRRHGFAEYDGPTFEYLELYTAKSGDGIVSELFNFEDRGGRQLALRPEMTPTLARMVAARANALPKPIKWFAVPNFFRAERPQRGRLREFLQWNVDIIGAAGEAETLADAECILVAVDFLRSAGFSPEQVEIRISSRALLAELLNCLGVENERHPATYTLLDKKEKQPDEVWQEELRRSGITPDQQQHLTQLAGARGAEAHRVIQNTLKTSTSPDGAAYAQLQQLFVYLRALGVADYCVFDLGVVRGLAYYTGVVFEAYSKGTLQRAICGGGRYANLLSAMGGGALSGVGFGMGDVIVLDQLAEMNLLPDSALSFDCYVAVEEQVDTVHLLKLVSLLRMKLGLACNYSYKSTSLKKQVAEAASQQVKYLLIMGTQLQLKNMQSGQQQLVAEHLDWSTAAAETELLSRLKQMLGNSPD